jgi:tetratricopeptide (TPR) repeat protein
VGEWLKEKGEAPKDWWEEVIAPLLPRNAENITADLLLDALWGRLSEGARAHGKALTLLRRPAPREVVDALGSTGMAAELIRAGMVTLFREQAFGENRKVEWVERWGMHGLVVGFTGGKATEEEQRTAHKAAYEVWIKQPHALLGDIEEGAFHWHTLGEGDRAWPSVLPYVVWLRDQARYRHALHLLNGCEAAGTTGNRLSLALMLTAQMRRRLGERSEDISAILDRALELAKSDDQIGGVLHEKGGFLKQQGKHREAESFLRKALGVLEKALGAKDVRYGVALHELGDLLREQGRSSEAELPLRQALAIFERARGTDDRLYGETLSHLGRVLRDQGNYEKAESLLRQALLIIKRALGEQHPTYGETQHALATVLRQRNKLDEAESLLHASIAIDERAFGPDHLSYGDSLNELGLVLLEQDQDARAEEVFSRAVTK